MTPPITPDEIDARYRPLLLLSALPFESKVLLKHDSRWKQQRTHELRIYSLPAGDTALIECGMGKSPGLAHLEDEIKRVKPGLVINFGICGALDPGMEPLQTYRIEEVTAPGKNTIEIDPLPALKGPGKDGGFPIAALLTVDVPVLDSRMRDELFARSRAALVDMEAYHFALICMNLNIPMVILKTVSDMADENAVDHVKQNLKRLQKELMLSLNRLMVRLQTVPG